MAFWSRFALSFFACGLLLTGIGSVAVNLLTSRPYDKFRTATYEFELVPGWDCQLEFTTYVCSYATRDKQKGAIVIATTKFRGRNDTLDAYEAHLKTPRMVPDDNGKMTPSTILSLDRRQIGGREWTHAVHTGSEILAYRTHYMATVSAYLGVLVTFSVHKNHTQTFTPQFDHMINSLRLYERAYETQP